MLILVIGDFHIPYRASCIPAEFADLLKSDRIQHIVCTGNLNNQATLEFLHTICHDIHIVHGGLLGGSLAGANSDSPNLASSSGTNAQAGTFPEYKVITVGHPPESSFRIGLVHGHQILPKGDLLGLLQFQRELNVDILVHGNTHVCDVSIDNGEIANGSLVGGCSSGALLVNPGSATGAFTIDDSVSNDLLQPSFVLLEFGHDKAVNVFTYTLDNATRKVNIDRIVYKK